MSRPIDVAAHKRRLYAARKKEAIAKARDAVVEAAMAETIAERTLGHEEDTARADRRRACAALTALQGRKK